MNQTVPAPFTMKSDTACTTIHFLPNCSLTLLAPVLPLPYRLMSIPLTTLPNK